MYNIILRETVRNDYKGPNLLVVHTLTLHKHQNIVTTATVTIPDVTSVDVLVSLNVARIEDGTRTHTYR